MKTIQQTKYLNYSADNFIDILKELGYVQVRSFSKLSFIKGDIRVILDITIKYNILNSFAVEFRDEINGNILSIWAHEPNLVYNQFGEIVHGDVSKVPLAELLLSITLKKELIKIVEKLVI